MGMDIRGIRCRTIPMTQSWERNMDTRESGDQLCALMRKAEEGGKMNELLTVHNKEVKNAPMNRHYPPDDDEWEGIARRKFIIACSCKTCQGA